MSRISRQRGKSFELRAVHFWSNGGLHKVRRNHFEAGDLTGHPTFAIECKARATPIATIRKWLEQSEAAAEEGKMAIVHFHVLGTRGQDDIVILRASSLRCLHDGS